MAERAQSITVWFLALSAAHSTAMSRMALLAKSSITDRTHGEASDRQRPGRGEVSSTRTCSSHHCQGGRRSAGLQALQKSSMNGWRSTPQAERSRLDRLPTGVGRSKQRLGRFSHVLAAVSLSLTLLDTKEPLGVAEGRRGAVRAGYFFAGTSSNTRA